jgi:fructose/tagatose bisphosphate aldolase
MPQTSFHELMADARRGGYAVGCFSTWNLDSLMAVADAAENTNSPVIIAIRTNYSPESTPNDRDHVFRHASECLSVCRGLSVPACTMFDESTHLNSVHRALELGLGVVAYRNLTFTYDIELQIMRGLVGSAHYVGSAVEAQLPKMTHTTNGHSQDAAAGYALTDPKTAEQFVRQIGVDALVVNIDRPSNGSLIEPCLDFTRLFELSRLDVPLVLHEPTSLNRHDLSTAIAKGIRKINVGSALKSVYRQAVQDEFPNFELDYDLRDLADDRWYDGAIPTARNRMRRLVENFMRSFACRSKTLRVEQLTAHRTPFSNRHSHSARFAKASPARDFDIVPQFRNTFPTG